MTLSRRPAADPPAAVHAPARRRAAHRPGRPALPPHPRRPVGARHRHRDRRPCRRARHHQVQPVGAARRDRPARHQPAHRDQRPDAWRPGSRAPGHRDPDDPPDRGRRAGGADGDPRQCPRLPQRQGSRSSTPAAWPRGRRTRRCSPCSAAPSCQGTFLSAAESRYPVTVLGYQAAASLGIAALGGSAAAAVFLGGRWFTVAGILNPLPLAPEIDRSALVGFPVAAADLGYDGHPSRIYVTHRRQRDRPGRRPARPDGQPADPGRRGGQPALGRAHRAARGRQRVHRAVPRPRRRRAARRRHRHRQRHGHRRP